MYNAVGIDVSKDKSTITVLQPGNAVIHKPFDVLHTSQEFNELFDSPIRNDGNKKWVDNAYSFWHMDCVRKIGLKTFTELTKPILQGFARHYSRS